MRWWALGRSRGFRRVVCLFRRICHTHRYVLEMLDMIQTMERIGAALEPPPPPAGATGGAQPEVTCDEHGRPCVLFCYQEGCKVMLCASCPIQDHSDHSDKLKGVNEKLENSKYFEEIEEKVETIEEDVEDLIEAFNKNINTLAQRREDIWKFIDEKVNSVLKEAANLKTTVKYLVEKETERITCQKRKVLRCLVNVREILTGMKRTREAAAAAGNLGAFQMQSAQAKLEEITKLKEDIWKLDTSWKAPALCPETREPAIGKIQTRKMHGFLDEQ